ncbi:Hpt domain-containing protein [Actinophytocola sp.]|uniref:Hpt domain-containing protein n=1 Tax=Actinophytocola sp. TaxID=1872138 RepID=UPI002ED11844
MAIAENVGAGAGEAGAEAGEGEDLRQLRSSIEQRLDRLRFGKPAAPGDLAARVLDAFLADAPRCLDTIANAIGAGDITTAREQAHDLTSLSGYIGADDMVAACGDLRQRLKDGDLVHAAEVAAELRNGYERASRAIASM